MNQYPESIQKAICAVHPVSSENDHAESHRQFMAYLRTVQGGICHWMDFLLWLNTGKWPNIDVSTVVGELERLKAISHAKKQYGKVGACLKLLAVIRWSPEFASA
jgi:hypothetical protein